MESTIPQNWHTQKNEDGTTRLTYKRSKVQYMVPIILGVLLCATLILSPIGLIFLAYGIFQWLMSTKEGVITITSAEGFAFRNQQLAFRDVTNMFVKEDSGPGGMYKTYSIWADTAQGSRCLVLLEVPEPTANAVLAYIQSQRY